MTAFCGRERGNAEREPAAVIPSKARDRERKDFKSEILNLKLKTCGLKALGARQNRRKVLNLKFQI